MSVFSDFNRKRLAENLQPLTRRFDAASANYQTFFSSIHKAESAYDQVLAQQQHNFKALIGKAKLRNDQGDIETAKTLLTQAKQIDLTNFELQAWTEAQKLVQQAR